MLRKWLLAHAFVFLGAAVVVGVLHPDLMWAELTLTAAAVDAATVCGVQVARGRQPEGISFRLPVLLLVMGAGHLNEAFRVGAGLSPLEANLSDVLYLIACCLLVVEITPVLLGSAQFTSGQLSHRVILDSVLIGLGVGLLYYQGVVQPFSHDTWWSPLNAVATAYTVSCTTAAAAVTLRATQRRDHGSVELALTAWLVVAGVVAWATAKFGPDLRLLGVCLMLCGMALWPLAMSNPLHRRVVVVPQGEEKDRLFAVALHLGCWAVVFCQLLRHPATPIFTVLGVVSVLAIFLRVFSVRRTERGLVNNLRDLAFTDPLTGIGNRRTLQRAMAESSDAWVLSLDLDGFKQVNDTVGHEEGDVLLQRVAAALEKEASLRGHAARLGGDEFAAVVRCSHEDALAIGDRLVTSLALDPRFPWVTASVGLTRHPAGTDPATSLRDADVALAEAKRLGRSRVVELDPALLQRRMRELEIAAQLRANMDVHVVYQPIVALDPVTGEDEVAAFEALIRWTDSSLGPVTPSEVIAVCERHGLIGGVGRHVLRTAIDQARSWLAEGNPRQITVNVSWLQLRDDALVAELRDLLETNPDVAPHLVLEVTETVFAEDATSVDALVGLRDLGVMVAVDDFGSGSSTLATLRTLPADVLKLDMSLVRDITVDPTAVPVLRMVQELGQTLGMCIVVEGVEDLDTVQAVRELGFEFVQGFYFHRPADPADLAPGGRRRLPRRADYAGGSVPVRQRGAGSAARR